LPAALFGRSITTTGTNNSTETLDPRSLPEEKAASLTMFPEVYDREQSDFHVRYHMTNVATDGVLTNSWISNGINDAVETVRAALLTKSQVRRGHLRVYYRHTDLHLPDD
jgi:hypothetical protein